MSSSSSNPVVPSGSILVSHTWRKTQLATILSTNAHVKYTEDLDVVDFYPSGDVAVIFISEADLISGMAYRNRLTKFRTIIESNRGVVIAQKTRLTSEMFGSLQKYVALDLCLTLIPVSNIEEAANLLVQMEFCETRIHLNPFRRIPRNSNTPDAAILGCTTIIPGLGDKKALLLLDHFGSLKALSNASQEKIASIVGSATASSVYQFLHSYH